MSRGDGPRRGLQCLLSRLSLYRGPGDERGPGGLTGLSQGGRGSAPSTCSERADLTKFSRRLVAPGHLPRQSPQGPLLPGLETPTCAPSSLRCGGLYQELGGRPPWASTGETTGKGACMISALPAPVPCHHLPCIHGLHRVGPAWTLQVFFPISQLVRAGAWSPRHTTSLPHGRSTVFALPCRQPRPPGGAQLPEGKPAQGRQLEGARPT